ncbi:carnosine N-methyltransferase [Echria macrotheca]|uniref:carnosine N-methyltransferase n=1 Tax=Echria macrotheca TaxID=438768 RepID=A0AAJ0BPT3_9PEZI|nr:carnosine N-methyltransferase [Echria macrotheca]
MGDVEPGAPTEHGGGRLDDSKWGGIETSIEDPEEEKVIFCALDSFMQYARAAHFVCTHLRRQAFYALPQEQWQMLAAPPFNYLDTLEKVDEAINSNAELAEAIVRAGLPNFLGVDELPEGEQPRIPPRWSGCATKGDVDKARSTLRQFYRDWTAEGRAEREACYGFVMRALADMQAARKPDDKRASILVPGAGLGRLVFELCKAGFDVEGNEISYHQLLASSYILNCCEKAEKFTIYPWIHIFSNHRTRANHLRGYRVPDVHCAQVLHEAEQQNHGGTGEMSMIAADFLCLYSGEDYREMYDAVVTVFFLDTAPNLLRYLETIIHCLKPGGVLINIGPLLWHFENYQPGRFNEDGSESEGSRGVADPGGFELSDDEVMELVKRVGFEILTRETGIEAPYIHDTESMLHTVYKASAWVARKPGQPLNP